MQSYKFGKEKTILLNFEVQTLWGNFSSAYSRFYKVTMLESTNTTSEGKLQV